MVPAFSLNGVIVEFNNQPVLDIGELVFDDRIIHAVIGPSGAGKSTLLRVLNMLQKPTQGSVTYFGNPLPYNGANSLAARRSMSMVFQTPAMFSGNVYDNVALGLRLRDVKTKEVRAKVFQALETVGLTDLTKRSAATLSGGEAQRIALARALVVNPRVLLLDEPTANLDPGNVTIIEDVIKRIPHETGITIIIVTHNLYQAKRLSQQAVFLNKGKIVESSSTDEIFNNPKAQETKLFVSGEMVY